ncbi:MAG: hypothetical protein LBU88_10445 [Treponema sp.]|jgi:hypothetical protein|nr:hypothetical protein [Treponema sp.]
MEETKKGIIGVVAFLLCIFFFMLPVIQYTNNSNIALSGWQISTIRFKTLIVKEKELIDDELKKILENTEIEYSEIDNLEIIENTTEVESNEIDLIQIKEKDVTLNDILLDIYENNQIGINLSVVIFILLIIPIALIIMPFLKISFSILRNMFFVGTILNIVFIVIIYTIFGMYFKPSIFYWIILLIYIGMCGVIQYFKVSK